MPAKRIEHVKKRDGRVEAYDEAKLAEAIHRAATAAGQDNRYLANDLAGVVTTYLERYYDRSTPSSAEIQGMVEKILLETGHADIAKAYMVHRDQRPEPVAAAPATELFPPEPVLVDAATRDEVSAWGRERISAALIKEAGLDETTARDIATAVEARVFREGHRHVSTMLIRELVNAELLARGYHVKLRKQLVLGLPKYDLDRMVRPEEPAEGDRPAARAIDPERMCQAIGEMTMRQYVLQELYPRDVADAHIEGRVHFHHVEHPMKLWWQAPSLEMVRRNGVRGPLLSDAPRTGRGLTAHIAALIAELSPYTAESVELAHANSNYAPLLGDPAEEAVGLLRAIAGRHIALGIDLGIPAYLKSSLGEYEARANAFAVELLRAARELSPELVFSVGEGAFGDPLREACRYASERGSSLFLFERGATPPSRVSRWSAGEHPYAIAQTASINLPQAFYRSEGGGDFYAELERAVESAVKGHLQKRALLRRSTAAGEADYVVALSGLREATRLMSAGDPAADDGALRLALRVVSYAHLLVKEEGAKHGLPLVLHDVADAEAAGRFTRIDRQLYPRARSLDGGYAPGLRLGGTAKPADLVAAEARFHALVPSGAATLPAAARAAMSAGDLCALVEHAFRGTRAAMLRIE
jgi:ribonucleoside-triphosphate reductase